MTLEEIHDAIEEIIVALRYKQLNRRALRLLHTLSMKLEKEIDFLTVDEEERDVPF